MLAIKPTNGVNTMTDENLREKIKREIAEFNAGKTDKNGNLKLSRDYDVRPGKSYWDWHSDTDDTIPADPAERASILSEEQGLWYKRPDPDAELRLEALRCVKLTDRQEEVMRLFRRSGMTQEEAGRILGIKHSAVHYHLRAIEKKIVEWVTDKKAKSGL